MKNDIINNTNATKHFPLNIIRYVTGKINRNIAPIYMVLHGSYTGDIRLYKASRYIYPTKTLRFVYKAVIRDGVDKPFFILGGI